MLFFEHVRTYVKGTAPWRACLAQGAAHEAQSAQAGVLVSDESRRRITLERLRAQGWVRLPVEGAPFASGFPTASGKLEFYAERMAADGHDPLAGNTPPYETVSGDQSLTDRFPFCLIAAAAHTLLNSTFADWAPPAERDADMGGGAVFHDNRVQIEKHADRHAS